ncbi:MAG: CapA family protein, partial [Candidatus Paceibacterota bacterium]
MNRLLRLSLFGTSALAILGVPLFTVPASPLALSSGGESATLTFVGDIMLDRYILKKARPQTGAGHGFENIAVGFNEVFNKSDLILGNLEGPVTTTPSLSEHTYIGDQNNMRFTFSPESLAFLTANNINLVSIGNNHITDFGPDGVRQTKHYLTQAGIQFVGDPYDKPRAATTTINGVSIAFIAYNQFSGQSGAETVSAIERAGETTDHTVVLAHWGEEYQSTPTVFQRDLARRFVDAGATLVVGTHPHVVQTTETYGEGLILYSLGNFVFDQYWHPAVRCGLVATVTLDRETLLGTSTTTARSQKNGTTIHKA